MFNAGDWVVFDMRIGQVKEIRDDIWEFSDGFCSTSGHRLVDRFRPLTLRNKRIVETFDVYYRRLSDLDGNAGFNFPDIRSYFSSLAMAAMDDESNSAAPFDKAQAFIRSARDYEPMIDGVPLFRPNLRRAI